MKGLEGYIHHSAQFAIAVEPFTLNASGVCVWKASTNGSESNVYITYINSLSQFDSNPLIVVCQCLIRPFSFSGLIVC
jgi:hypothetical protein